MDEKYDKIASVNTGRRATLAMEIIGPEIDAVRKSTITRMKQSYRDGSVTEVRLLAEVAALCVLDDLEGKLRLQIKRGHKSLEELENAT